jgi:hypothetical protein
MRRSAAAAGIMLDRGDRLENAFRSCFGLGPI